MKSWRNVYPVKKYTNEDFINKGKQAVAMRRVNQMLAKGTIEKPTACQVCGKPAKRIIAHHYMGYENPFSVWFVCSKCNYHLPNGGIETKEEAFEYVMEKFAERIRRYISFTARLGYDWFVADEQDAEEIEEHERICKVCDRVIQEKVYVFMHEFEAPFSVGECCIKNIHKEIEE